MYKLVAIDLDGTLLTDEKTLTKENIDVLKKISDLGYEVVIATGRNYYSARELTKEIWDSTVYICNNGSVARNSKNNHRLFSNYINKEDFITIMEAGIERNLYPMIHVDYYDEGYDVVCIEDSKFLNNLNKNIIRYQIVEDYLDDSIDRILAMVYPGEKEVLTDFHSYIIKKFPNRYNSHIMENMVLSRALLEVMNPMGNKWYSLKKYAKSKGIRTKEIIAIGDNNNDIEMIKNAGLGIAMKNGEDLAKSVADIISQKNNNDSGVGFELKRVLNI